MAVLLLFAAAREAAGTRQVDLDGATVGEVLDAAVARFGDPLARVLAHSRVWLDGEQAERSDPVRPGSEVAVLPPVSGG
jgi:molybdopterin converting factor small subunit